MIASSPMPRWGRATPPGETGQASSFCDNVKKDCQWLKSIYCMYYMWGAKLLILIREFLDINDDNSRWLTWQSKCLSLQLTSEPLYLHKYLALAKLLLTWLLLVHGRVLLSFTEEASESLLSFTEEAGESVQRLSSLASITADISSSHALSFLSLFVSHFQNNLPNMVSHQIL